MAVSRSEPTAQPALLRYLGTFHCRSCSAPEETFRCAAMEIPNWQDKFLGGMILAGFVVVATIAGLFSLVTWSDDGSRDHASTRPGQSKSATN